MAKQKIDQVKEEELEEEVEEEEEEETTASPAKRSAPRSMVRIVIPLIVVLLLCALVPIILSMTGIVKIPGLSSSKPVAKTVITATKTITAVKTSAVTTATTVTTATKVSNNAVEATATAPTTHLTATVVLTEPAATATTVVVQGPTATPSPEMLPTETPLSSANNNPPPTATAAVESQSTGATTAETGCDQNKPPLAQISGSPQVMLGKGQAVANFDGANSRDADGTITTYQWDFGDSNSASGQSVSHNYQSVGDYIVTLTITDNCGSTSQITFNISVVGATPPVESTPAVTPTATLLGETGSGSGIPADATLGGCHKVTPGQTLYGIAAYYGVDWPDLAAVNGVSPEYFVIEGQGLFIPIGEIKSGAHVYQVDEGDTFYSIAYQCGLVATDVAQANNMSIDENLAPGQMVVIPLWSGN